MNSDIINGIIMFVMLAVWLIAVFRVRLFDCMHYYGKKDLTVAGLCLLGAYLFALYSISGGSIMSESNEQSIAHCVEKFISNLLNQNAQIMSCFCDLLFGGLTFVIWGMTEKRISDRLLKSNKKFSIGMLFLIAIKQVYTFEWSVLHMMIALLLASAICSAICVFHKQKRRKYIYPILCLLMLVVLVPTMNVIYEVALVGFISLAATVLANVVFHYSHYLRDVLKYVINIGVIIALIFAENILCNICL